MSALSSSSLYPISKYDMGWERKLPKTISRYRLPQCAVGQYTLRSKTVPSLLLIVTILSAFFALMFSPSTRTIVFFFFFIGLCPFLNKKGISNQTGDPVKFDIPEQ